MKREQKILAIGSSKYMQQKHSQDENSYCIDTAQNLEIAKQAIT